MRVYSPVGSWKKFLVMAAGCAAWLLSIAAPVASAQKLGGLSDADEKALSGYRLTTDKLDRFDTVNKKLAAAMDTDPQLAKEMATQNALNYGTTLDEALGQFDARAPRLAAVIKDAGLSDRDYVLTLFSIMMTATGQAIKQAAPDQPLPASIPAENVAFAEKNRVRFQEVMTHLEHLSAKKKKKASSDETTEE